MCSGGQVSFIIFLMLSGHWKLKLLMSSRGCCTPVSSRSLWMGIIQLSKPMPHLSRRGRGREKEGEGGGGRSYPSHFKDFTSPLIPLGVITYTYRGISRLTHRNLWSSLRACIVVAPPKEWPIMAALPTSSLAWRETHIQTGHALTPTSPLSNV